MAGCSSLGFTLIHNVADLIHDPQPINRSQIVTGPFVSGESIELSLNSDYVCCISSDRCPLAGIEAAAQERGVVARWSYDEEQREHLLFLHCDIAETLRILLDVVAQTVLELHN